MIVHEVPAEVAADWVACLAELDEIRRNKTAKVKTREGPDYSYNFADLASVLGYVRPILASHGLAVSQTIDDGPTVTTQVWHRSGHMFELGGATVKPTKGDPQSMGSAITYARRYSLLSALDLATEDDDGKAASAPAPRPVSATTSEPLTDSPTAAMTKKVMATFRDKGITDRQAQYDVMSDALERDDDNPVTSWGKLTKAEASRVINAVSQLPDMAPAEGT